VLLKNFPPNISYSMSTCINCHINGTIWKEIKTNLETKDKKERVVWEVLVFGN